jgi:hypothetical protein
MDKFLSIRWVDASRKAKPYNVVAYSVHTDANAARDFIADKMREAPDIRPELRTDDDKIGARVVRLPKIGRLRNHFDDTSVDAVHDAWIPVTKNGQQSLLLRSLHEVLHADGGSENNLPIVLIPAKN